MVENPDGVEVDSCSHPETTEKPVYDQGFFALFCDDCGAFIEATESLDLPYEISDEEIAELEEEFGCKFTTA